MPKIKVWFIEIRNSKSLPLPPSYLCHHETVSGIFYGILLRWWPRLSGSLIGGYSVYPTRSNKLKIGVNDITIATYEQSFFTKSQQPTMWDRLVSLEIRCSSTLFFTFQSWLSYLRIFVFVYQFRKYFSISIK